MTTGIFLHKVLGAYSIIGATHHKYWLNPYELSLLPAFAISLITKIAPVPVHTFRASRTGACLQKGGYKIKQAPI